MKNSILSSFLKIFLFSLAIISNSQTYIEGGIYSDTTFTESQSPYIVTNDLVVFPDVILTIEPGVTLKFYDEKKLEIRGKLNAIGTLENHIVFTSNSSNPTKGSWVGIIVTGNNPMLDDFYQVRLDYIEGYYAHLFIDLDIAYQGPYIFTNSIFSDNQYVSNDNGYPYTQFENCNFMNNGEALKGGSNFQITIRNCNFIDNFAGASYVDLVENSYFRGNEIYGLSQFGQATNCTFENHSNIAVSNSFNSNYNHFVGNTLQNNEIGLRIATYFNGVIELYDNKFCDNTYSVYLATSSNVDIPNNCWCSNDPDYISSKIYDGYDDVSLGLVNFTPFIDCQLNAENQPSGKTITIYPNPATDKLYIENLKKSSTVKIINVEGKYIMEKTIEPKRFIDISALPKGVYVAILDGNSYKFIKN